MSTEKSQEEVVLSSQSSYSESSNESKFLIYNRQTKEQVHINKDWTEEEELQARKKVDYLVIPLLIVGFFVLQLDRGNIANALAATLMQDLKIDTNQVNVGTALFNVGIVIFEIPSNIVLQKVGPAKWLSFQVVAWSLIATLQSQIKTYGQFLATRFLLGMFESGFIPGTLYYLSTWYTKKELTARHTAYFTGNYLASCTSGLIAAGILKDIAGRNGIAGWKWIFIIEGVIGVGYGIIFAFAIPNSIETPRPFWARTTRFNFLTERQQHILSQRVIIDDPEKATNASHIGLSDLKIAFMRPAIWIHFVLSLGNMIHSQALSTYTPLIMRSFGYSPVEANARSSIPNWMALVVMIFMTWTSNRFAPRGASIVFLLVWKLVVMIALRCVTTSKDNTMKFAVLIIMNTVGATPHILNTSWLSLNCKTPTERSISMAMVVMAANIAGIAGAQVLREGDRPYYKSGFSALIGVDAFTLIWGIGMIIFYIIKNKKLNAAQPKADLEDSLEVEETEKLTQKNTIIFVGKGDPEHDQALLDSLKGEYNVKDKEFEAEQRFNNFRHTP